MHWLKAVLTGDAASLGLCSTTIGDPDSSCSVATRGCDKCKVSEETFREWAPCGPGEDEFAPMPLYDETIFTTNTRISSWTSRNGTLMAPRGYVADVPELGVIVEGHNGVPIFVLDDVGGEPEKVIDMRFPDYKDFDPFAPKSAEERIRDALKASAQSSREPRALELASQDPIREASPDLLTFEPAPRGRRCAQGHSLEQRKAGSVDYRCDVCCKDIATGEVFYDCRECNWSMCRKCHGKSGGTLEESTRRETSHDATR